MSGARHRNGTATTPQQTCNGRRKVPANRPRPKGHVPVPGTVTEVQQVRDETVTAGSRIGADVGGTFTDVILRDAAGRISFTKVLSTPPAYDRAVVDAVAELAG